jgi:pyruvate/2-oxoacid:ferredoxin oxidoreductase beta subunit
MNTGIQRSGSTPFGASTTTTPVGKKTAGKLEMKKDVASIMIAHNIPYVATASIGYPMDYLAKLEKIKTIKGCRFMQVYASCPTGWRLDTELSVDVAKRAVECGLWTLFEYENGKFTINRKPKDPPLPVKEYLKGQGRFKHLTDADIQKLQEFANMKMKYYGRMAECWK